MKKSIDYRITVDEEGDRVIFEDLTNGKTLYSGPGNYWDEAELYRYIAVYFLSKAYFTEHCNTYDNPPAFTSKQEWQQIYKMIEGWYHNGFLQCAPK